MGKVMTSTLPEDMRERVNTLYRPDLTDLELNEHQGKERLVVYLDDVVTLLEETDRKAREDFAMKIFTVKTEGLFDNGDLFIKRKPIEQVVINELGYETYKAIQEAANALQSPSKESESTGWVAFTGNNYTKQSYDVKLPDGSIFKRCWPNAGHMNGHFGSFGPDDDVQIRPSKESKA